MGAVQRELSVLTSAGLIRREVRGRQVYFTANPDAPVYPELRGLLEKTAGLADLLRAALQPFAMQGPRIMLIGTPDDIEGLGG